MPLFSHRFLEKRILHPGELFPAGRASGHVQADGPIPGPSEGGFHEVCVRGARHDFCIGGNYILPDEMIRVYALAAGPIVRFWAP